MKLFLAPVACHFKDIALDQQMALTLALMMSIAMIAVALGTI